MPRLKGIGMPSKRKRKTAKLQKVPEPDADEVDQGSACGPASPTHSSPPTVDSDDSGSEVNCGLGNRGAAPRRKKWRFGAVSSKIYEKTTTLCTPIEPSR